MASGSTANKHWSECHDYTAFHAVTRNGVCKVTVHGRMLFATFFVIPEFNVGEFKRQLKCKLAMRRS